MKTKLIALALISLITATCNAQAAKLTLNWTQPASSSTNAPTGVLIQRGLNTNSFVAVATVAAPSVLTWLDTNCAVATVYYYRIANTNAAGISPWSNIASGSTLGLPTFTVQPPALVTVTSGQPFSLSVVVSGTAPISYQWTLQGVAIAGATSATYSVSAMAASQAGNYQCNVTDAVGSASSSVSAVTVITFPSQAPQTLTVTPTP